MGKVARNEPAEFSFCTNESPPPRRRTARYRHPGALPCRGGSRAAQQPATSNQRPRRRGGQPGNINALRTGRRSPRLRALVETLIADRETRALILRVARIQQAGVLQQLEDAAYQRIARRCRTFDNLHLDVERYLQALERAAQKRRRSNGESRAK